MEYITTTRAASRLAADCLIVGIYDRGKLGAAAADIDNAAKGWLADHIRAGDLSTDRGRAAVLPAPKGVKAKRVLIVGLGKASDFGPKHYRQAISSAMAAIRDSKVRDIAVGLMLEDVGGSSAYRLARHTSETIGNALYRFDEMKSGKKRPGLRPGKITLAIKARGDAKPAKLGCAHGSAIAGGMSLTKDLGNLPPNVCTPAYLAKTANGLAKKHAKLQTKVLNEAEIKRLGMHSFLSVTGGAVEPAKLIVMQYRGATGQQPVVLVGKGITFDSGGISLKPGPGMDEMKYDMCGAATVIATIGTVAALKLPINVIAVVPSCENMPSGTATRPGDIVKSMSGQTIEILNTDAEGRLILCDALTYSRRFKPDTIIDVATLTGACVIALGHHRTAVMSKNDALADELLAAGIAAEDRGWPLPVADEYDEALKSNFADFANVGGREGGAVTAACFLARFTQDMNWAHLDIAGTAWQGGARKGASGRPVAMLSEFLLQRAGALP
jgi:leucyl aminopeptidase